MSTASSLYSSEDVSKNLYLFSKFSIKVLNFSSSNNAELSDLALDVTDSVISEIIALRLSCLALSISDLSLVALAISPSIIRLTYLSSASSKL